MKQRSIAPLFFMMALSFIPILSIHVPRGLCFLPFSIGLAMSLWWFFNQRHPIALSKSYLYCAISIGGLCIISSLWAATPMDVYFKAVKISIMLLLGVFLFTMCLSIPKDRITPYLWMFPIAVGLAALLCSFELSFNYPFYRMFHGDDFSTLVNSAVMNRGTVCVVFAYFIGLLFTHHSDRSKSQKIMLIGFMTLCVIGMLAITSSQSAQLAFALGVFTYLFFPVKFKTPYRFLAALFILAIALTPWIVHILFETFIDTGQSIPWLKDGYAGNRVEIWNFVMNYALHNPLYGYGMEATRFVKEFHHDYIYHKGPTVLHPHNFSIQLWIEFGAIGIIGMAAFLTFLLEKISMRDDVTDKKATTALFISVMTVAAIGYGIWQAWWIGELIFLASLSALMTDRDKAKLWKFT